MEGYPLIKQLSVRNFAIFKDVAIDFNNGLSIITGESGAGKSVLVNALSLISGTRATREMVRNESPFAMVEAVFELNAIQKGKLEGIEGMELDPSDSHFVITRQIYADQRSICRINGKIRNLSWIIEAASVLMDIHGQYENQSLLDEKNHLRFLDMYADDIQPLKGEYAILLNSYREAVSYVLQSSGSLEEREREKSILKFQIMEIDQSKIGQENIEELEQQKHIMENAEKYKQALYHALKLLEGEEGESVENIFEASRQLEGMKEIGQTGETIRQVTECYYTLKEAVNGLRETMEGIEYDPLAYDALTEKLEGFEKLYRKYGKSKENVMQYRDAAMARLDELDHFETRYGQRLHEIQEMEQKLLGLGGKISQARKHHARLLEDRIVRELKELEMKDVQFKIGFHPQNEINKLGYTDFSQDGMETCEFTISTNKGMPVMPLKKIASGGEISRVMLALKGIISLKDEIFTLVFDEIDSGISGQTAVVAGEKLRKLSRDKQVLCITHSPQIVAKGDNHYVIGKNTQGDATMGEVRMLETREERIRELARIIDGDTLTKEGMEHARNILEQGR
ncbi:MAG: DNA repair protein RecN [Clostridia bacterium]